ncbi:nucleoside monophosphate kinase [Bradyrhizobium sp. DN5]|uniref:nucleoside monophosphate kinase n=1 Tax=Bradyrhizobium sp. DN5 TaxID=3056950 RepID=UPI003524E5B8
MLVTLFGPPGSGKSTLGDHLEGSHGFTHIAIGRLLKNEAFRNQIGVSETRVMTAIQTGRTISFDPLFDWLDQTVLDLNKPIVIDGYPRESRALPRFNILANKLKGKRAVLAIHLPLTFTDSRNRLARRGRSDDTAKLAEVRYDEYINEQLPLFAELHPSVSRIEFPPEATTNAIASSIIGRCIL